LAGIITFRNTWPLLAPKGLDQLDLVFIHLLKNPVCIIMTATITDTGNSHGHNGGDGWCPSQTTKIGTQGHFGNAVEHNDVGDPSPYLRKGDHQRQNG